MRLVRFWVSGLVRGEETGGRHVKDLPVDVQDSSNMEDVSPESLAQPEPI